jgi:hypothetical protein
VVVVITPLLVVVVVMMIMAPPPIVIVMVMMMVGPILSQLRLGVWLARFIGARRRPQLIGGSEERDRVWDRLQQLGVGGRAQDFSDAFRRRRVHRAHRRQRGDRAYKTYDLLVHFFSPSKLACRFVAGAEIAKVSEPCRSTPYSLSKRMIAHNLTPRNGPTSDERRAVFAFCRAT